MIRKGVEMIFTAVGPNRYSVHRSANDCAHHGTVEKQEYTSIDMKTGKRVVKRFWIACGRASGWRSASKQKFKTREEAAEFLLKESSTPYADRDMQWTKKQGQTAAAKGRGNVQNK
jgi:hypothetical protein